MRTTASVRRKNRGGAPEHRLGPPCPGFALPRFLPAPLRAVASCGGQPCAVRGGCGGSSDLDLGSTLEPESRVSSGWFFSANKTNDPNRLRPLQPCLSAAGGPPSIGAEGECIGARRAAQGPNCCAPPGKERSPSAGKVALSLLAVPGHAATAERVAALRERRCRTQPNPRCLELASTRP